MLEECEPGGAVRAARPLARAAARAPRARAVSTTTRPSSARSAGRYAARRWLRGSRTSGRAGRRGRDRSACPRRLRRRERAARPDLTIRAPVRPSFSRLRSIGALGVAVGLDEDRASRRRGRAPRGPSRPSRRTGRARRARRRGPIRLNAASRTRSPVGRVVALRARRSAPPSATRDDPHDRDAPAIDHADQASAHDRERECEMERRQFPWLITKSA